jgi:hypothetical protein
LIEIPVVVSLKLYVASLFPLINNSPALFKFNKERTIKLISGLTPFYDTLYFLNGQQAAGGAFWRVTISLYLHAFGCKAGIEPAFPEPESKELQPTAPLYLTPKYLS